ncbi:PQQ-binding-like beta-propeller repeat protein [Mycobacterium sp. DSM 3803]|nr:PQQ-binding-like beta-propeller repeat protein [Mycobacterium sp. DSM 3803]
MSGASFNPPPAWPVPRGWTPPPEWVPDSSWPPAPAGWQFWIEDTDPLEEDEQIWQPRREPSVPDRRRSALIAGAVILAVTLIAGTVAVVSWLRDDSRSVARPEGMLPGTYPTAPEVDWSVRVGDFTSGAEPAFASPEYGAAYYASVGAVVADEHVIVHVVPERSSPEDAQLVAFSLADGRVEWSRPSNARDGCAREPLGNLLPCRNSENYGPTSEVYFIDIATGEVRSTASVPFFLNMLASDGQSLYTAGYVESEGLVVAKGSAEDLISGWQVSIPGGACDGYGGGDAYDLRVRDGIVSGFQGGGANIAVHASDGSPVFDHPVMDVSVLDGPTITARKCMAGRDIDNWPTEVSDGAGTVLFTTDDRLMRHSLEVRAGPPTVLVTADGVGVDAKTGETRWRQADWPSESVRTAVVGDTLLYEGDRSDLLHADSLYTGTELWDRSPLALGLDTFTDGRNLISVSHAEIRARSLADGGIVWSTSVPMVTDYDAVVLLATGHGLLFVTGRQIGLLRPTGPAAPVPGSGTSVEAEETDGGTTLVTKCGTPPTFEPQEIVTESGALAITMKIVAKCPGGDVLSGARTRISVTTPGGQNVASGVFDLSAEPIVIAGGAADEPWVTHRFHFPPGTFWRLPVSVDEAPDSGSTQRGRVDIEAKTLLVECETDGSGESSGQTGSGSGASTATGPAAPRHGDHESASFDALRAIANADRPFVSSHLADRWVPQLSSKRPGLVADGIVWNNAETLREHLDLRLKYPEVRLLWTGDWSTFSAPDFWVTIAGVTFPDAVGALAWCRNHGIDRDHCYAKLVSTTHPVDGSTAFNP